MRFSAQRFQFIFKVGSLAVLLLLSIGFYCGLVQYVLLMNFWPALEGFSGLIFFFSVGIFIGFAIPDILRPKGKLPQPQDDIIERNLNVLVRYSYLIFAMAIIILLLMEFFLLRIFDRNITRLTSHFLFTPITWRIFCFMMPICFVLSLGIVSGLVCDFTYGFFVHFKYPTKIRAGAREIHRCICSITGLVLLSLASSWIAGFYYANLCSIRWEGLIAIPVILCLAVILLLLIEPEKHVENSDYFVSDNLERTESIPEYAANSSWFATIGIIVLSGLGFWFAIHLKYALINWVGALEAFSGHSVGLAIFILLSIGIGLEIGNALLSGNITRAHKAIIDGQSLTITLFGALAIVIVFLLSKVSAINIVPIIGSGGAVLFMLSLFAMMWAIAFAFAIPALAIGKANRFELWTAIGCRFAIGMMLGAIGYFCWHYVSGENLSALITGTLVAIVTGGIGMLYGGGRNDNDIDSSEDKKWSKFIYVISIVLLYVMIIISVVLIPLVRPVWLGRRGNKKVTIAEGTLAVASVVRNGRASLYWAGQEIYERSNKDVREELFELIRKIIKLNLGTDREKARCLFVGLPFVERKDIKRKLGIRSLEQIDIDEAVRKAELELMDIKYPVAIKQFDNIYCYHKPYDLVIAIGRNSCGKEITWPDGVKLFERLSELAVCPKRVWMISSDKIEQIFRLNTRYGGKLKTSTISGENQSWRISSLSSIIAILDNKH